MSQVCMGGCYASWETCCEPERPYDQRTGIATASVDSRPVCSGWSSWFLSPLLVSPQTMLLYQLIAALSTLVDQAGFYLRC